MITAHAVEKGVGKGKVAEASMSSYDGIPEEGGSVGTLVEQETSREKVVMGGIGAEEVGGQEGMVKGEAGGSDEERMELLGLGHGCRQRRPRKRSRKKKACQ